MSGSGDGIQPRLTRGVRPQERRGRCCKRLTSSPRCAPRSLPERRSLSLSPSIRRAWGSRQEWGFLAPGQYLIHDRDGKYCPVFQQLIDTAGVKRVPLPPQLSNLNAYAERWVRSVKEECLSRLILFGEASLQHALREYVAHYHHERNP
jgi:hypothetical protein